MKKGNKIKKIERNNMTFLEIKSEKGQILNPTEVEAITKNRVEGLLSLTVRKGRKSFKLIYNITGMQSLNEYLRNTQLDKQLFGFLLQNILNMLKTIESNYFQYRSLLLTFGKVKVEPASKRLYFIYVPIQYYDNEVSLKDFLLNIINVAQFVQNEDLSFVSEYLQILNTGVNFSVFDLEEYINSLTGNSGKSNNTKKCPNCGNIVSDDANFCSNCQYSFKKKGITGKTGGDVIYDPFANDGEDDDDNKLDWIKQEKNDPDERADEKGLTDDIGTCVLGSDGEDDSENPTTILDQPKKIVKVGFIRRLSNNEKKEINKNDYVIGRSLKSDFVVPDNSAVGRGHAIISVEDDHYYILDNNSKNRTYLNGKVIPQSEKIELFNDTKIRLANEDFIFNIVSMER